MDTVRIISSSATHVTFEVNRNACKLSKRLEDLIIIASKNQNKVETIEISLDIPVNLLEHIIEYIKFHEYESPSAIEKPILSPNIEENVSGKFDCDFINHVWNQDKTSVINLCIVASYLHLDGLEELCMAMIASLMKNQPQHKLATICQEITPQTIIQF